LREKIQFESNKDMADHPHPTLSAGIIPTATTLARPRLDSVDILRGLVMVLMALDHTRGFFSNITFYPLDLAQTNVPLFLTRWITHYCAPVFVFLAGTGAFLSKTRGKTTAELSWFLFTRGLWLVFLELTIIRCFGWMYNFDFHFTSGGVIWAIGWSMVALSALVFLPTWAITAFGVLMIAVHNAFDNVTPESFGSFSWLWVVLHTGGGLEPFPGYRLGIGYPLVPWIGVMAAGYGFGSLLLREATQRRKWMLGLGVALTLLFVILRFGNKVDEVQDASAAHNTAGVVKPSLDKHPGYGDPHPWSPQKNAIFTVFSFIHCQKYPPSLLYVLMTLGPALILLTIFDAKRPWFAKQLIVFGRVPLFYYLLHLPLIHGLAVLVAYARYHQATWLFNPTQPPNSPSLAPSDNGFGLPVVYLVWIIVVLLLYPLCKWFAGLKQRRRDPWLSYL
jgi:uncharacterized membrane protein